jgi:multidrug efflux pump subunit AcrA (membrane-fusion protein)
MVIITTLYLMLVYLLFFKFKLLPWNKISQGLTVLVGVVILSAFLVGLQGLTPSSVQGAITGRIVEIAPQVSGRVITVEAEPNNRVDAGAVLFSIDPVSFESRVDELEARLALAQLRLAPAPSSRSSNPNPRSSNSKPRWLERVSISTIPLYARPLPA